MSFDYIAPRFGSSVIMPSHMYGTSLSLSDGLTCTSTAPSYVPSFYCTSLNAATGSATIGTLCVGSGGLSSGWAATVASLHVGSGGLWTTGVPAFSDNAAALAGGVGAGGLYRTGGDPDHLCVVH